MRRRLLWSMLAAGIGCAALSAQTVYHKGDAGLVMPTVVRMEQARYTDGAWDQRIEGLVMLRAIIRSDGTVSNIEVTQSLDRQYGLDDKAIEALKHWQFKPGTKDGKPVDVQVDVQNRFTLKKSVR